MSDEDAMLRLSMMAEIDSLRATIQKLSSGETLARIEQELVDARSANDRLELELKIYREREAKIHE